MYAKDWQHGSIWEIPQQKDCVHLQLHSFLEPSSNLKTNSHAHHLPLQYVMPHAITNKNLVICNHSLCNYVQLNVTYDYKWLPMRLFFKFEWILVVLSISRDYELFHLSNKLIFHDVFVFFTTSYNMFSCTCNQSNHIIVA